MSYKTIGPHFFFLAKILYKPRSEKTHIFACACAKTKTQISLAVTTKLIRDFVFGT